MGRYREMWGRYGPTARQAGPLARLAPSSMVLIGIAASPSTLAAWLGVGVGVGVGVGLGLGVGVGVG